ncbi:MAG: GyrI-like domain-containing protein [Dehalococcoidia bacterium]|nr:GyrI-like domain-containing protein [Dehalococcoidia bacterium]
MANYTIEERSLVPQPTAFIHLEATVATIPQAIAEALGEIAPYLEESGIEMGELPFARYYDVQPEKVVFDAGFPVSRPVTPRGRVQSGELPGGPAIVTTHFGLYDQMRPAYEALKQWAQEHGRAAAGAPWELYYTDPAAEPNLERWKTEIVQPLAS